MPFPISRFAHPEEILLEEYEPIYRRILRSFLEVRAEMLSLHSYNDFGLLISPGAHGQYVVRHTPNPRLALRFPHLQQQSPAILAVWQELMLDFVPATATQGGTCSSKSQFEKPETSHSFP